MSSESSDDMTGLTSNSDGSDSEVEPDTDSQAVEDCASSSADAMEEEEEEEEDDDDDDPWSDLVQTVFDRYQGDMRQKVADLSKSDGISRAQAERQVYEEYLPCMNIKLRDVFVKFLYHMREMKKDYTYRQIMRTAQRMRDQDDMDFEESIIQATETRKVLITRVLRQWTPMLGDDGDDDDDDDDEDDDEDTNSSSST